MASHAALSWLPKFSQMKVHGASSTSMARFNISPSSMTATCTTLQMPSQMLAAVSAIPWKNPAMASMAP